ncbi:MULTISPECIES: DUF2316 family protein [unclassified Streptomyces]|uniref:DUF2316 family protein n=1 Tax=unclassified Streptomyces TaxID=2593676 RepID=UPI0035DE1C03
MSLNADERARTSAELHANLRLSGTDLEEARAALSLTPDRFETALNCSDAAKPSDVWLLRDHFQQLVQDQGGTPEPYTVLTEQARSAARRWFRLRRAPRRPQQN